MNKSKKRVLMAAGVLTGLGLIWGELRKIQQLVYLEEQVDQLLVANEALIMHQYTNNELIYERLDKLEDETGTVYAHLEVLADKIEGR